MPHIDFLTTLHKRTKRDYVGRVVSDNKAECATVAKLFGFDYWDGPRQYGYGGYRYDGRWKPIAQSIADHYQLKKGDRVLDVGCGKAHLLYELLDAVPGLDVVGVDISEYALLNCPEPIQDRLRLGKAEELPFEDNSFDLVISLNTIHNLHNFNLEKAIKEIERVGRNHKYVVVESYRNETEKANLLYWQLTCESFCTPEEWQWWFNHCNYKGDFSFIYFE